MKERRAYQGDFEKANEKKNEKLNRTEKQKSSLGERWSGVAELNTKKRTKTNNLLRWSRARQSH